MQTMSKIGASLDKTERDKIGGIVSSNPTQKIVPGPGNYDPFTDSLISRNASPKFGFGTSVRSATSEHTSRNKTTVPGPGEYEFKQIIGRDGPRNTIAARFLLDMQAKECSVKPGPG